MVATRSTRTPRGTPKTSRLSRSKLDSPQIRTVRRESIPTPVEEERKPDLQTPVRSRRKTKTGVVSQGECKSEADKTSIDENKESPKLLSDLSSRSVSPQIESSARKTPSNRKTAQSSKSECYDLILKTVKQRLMNSQWNVPTLNEHLETHRKALTDLIGRGAELNESNSILIEGPLGSGKRTLVKNAVKCFEDSQKSAKKPKANVKYVYLNGLLVSDVKTCLKEISRQLMADKALHESLFANQDNFDVDEEDDADGIGYGNDVMISVSQSLSLVLDTLHASRSSQSQCLVFVLEAFEHFAQSRSQMILYNLFDTCQSFRSPLVVVAVSNRLDSTELLEKRVKSRFSHRNITLWNDLSFDQWIQCAKDMLRVDSKSTQPFEKTVMKQWNQSVDALLKGDVTMIALEKIHSSFPTVDTLRALLLRFVVKCHRSESYSLNLFDSLLSDTVEEIFKGAHFNLHRNISLCELIMISTMAKIVRKEDDPREEMTFAMIYQEYSVFARRHQTHKRIDRQLALSCFSNLLELKLVSCCESKSLNRNMLKCYKKYRLMIDVLHVYDIVRNHPSCPSDVKMWALEIGDH